MKLRRELVCRKIVILGQEREKELLKTRAVSEKERKLDVHDVVDSFIYYVIVYIKGNPLLVTLRARRSICGFLMSTFELLCVARFTILCL